MTGRRRGAPAIPADPAARPEYRVEALAKGLRILSLFTEQRPAWRVSDIAPAAGMPLPTAYRVVMTLTAEGPPEPARPNQPARTGGASPRAAAFRPTEQDCR